MIRTYKYRLLPTKRQHAELAAILESQRQLYNAALEERVDAYRKSGLSIGYMQQSKSLTECRAALADMSAQPVAMQRETLKRIDRAMQAFFRRVSRAENPGFPRFKGKDSFTGFGFSQWEGVSIVAGRLRMKGAAGGIRVHIHRAMPNTKPKSAQVRRDSKGWYICLQFEVNSSPLASSDATIGLDVGLSAFVALSDGELIPNPRAAKRAHRELRRRQRALARCKKGSNRRRRVRVRVARLHQKIANVRRTHHFQIAAALVRRYDMIAVENLNVKGLVTGVLARDVHDAGWAQFLKILSDKAESAGRKVIAVDPRYTSQECPTCGNIKPKTLSERTHRCDCGCVMDRDVAAARVILNRAVVGPRTRNVAECGKRAA